MPHLPRKNPLHGAQWEKAYLASANTSDHIYDCHMNYINRTADGNYLIVGKQTDFPASKREIVAGTIVNRMLVLKVASDGALSWNKVIDAGDNADAVKFIQDRDGNYLIIGTAFAGTNPGVVMVKIDMPGTCCGKRPSALRTPLPETLSRRRMGDIGRREPGQA